VYKVYVIKQRKSGGSEVLAETRTQTPSFDAASAAFWALHGADYDNNHLLLMTKNNKQLNAYRYGSQPGERDYLSPGAELSQ
jgi:hypothetical protein